MDQLAVFEPLMDTNELRVQFVRVLEFEFLAAFSG